MAAKERQFIDVIVQGSNQRPRARLGRVAATGAVVVVATVAGFLLSMRDVPDDSGLPPPTAPPVSASPTSQAPPSVPAAPTTEPLVDAGSFEWLGQPGGVRFTIATRNAGPTTIHVEAVHLRPPPGVAVTVIGFASDGEAWHSTKPYSPSVELASGSSTNLVLMLSLDCDVVPPTPGMGPPFEITFTSAGQRKTQHFQPDQIPGGWLSLARKSACESSG